MAEKIVKAGVHREEGFLYYIGKDGNVYKVVMARGRGDAGKGKPSMVYKAGVKKESGYLYFLDHDGDISRAKMSHGGKKRK